MQTKLLKLFCALAFSLALFHPSQAQPALEKKAPAANPASSPAADRQETPYTQGLLWKIESAGTPPSYLFGTIHSDDPRVIQLPAPVKERFDRAVSFTMELITNGAGIVDMAQAMFFNDGRTLDKVLGKELYEQTLQILRNRGLPTQDIQKQKPWAVMMALSMPRLKSGLVLDMMLQLEAVKQGKQTYGLETMQEQIELFNNMPMSDQVHLLAETLRTAAQMDAQFEALLQRYLNRDLAGLMAINDNDQPAHDDAVYRGFMDQLLNKRNVKMLQRMLPRLKEGNAFIAVGALHLPGPEGLLSLLEKAGYHVTAVY